MTTEIVEKMYLLTYAILILNLVNRMGKFKIHCLRKFKPFICLYFCNNIYFLSVLQSCTNIIQERMFNKALF